VNTGGEGRGGPNNGTLSSEKIFNLQHKMIKIQIYTTIWGQKGFKNVFEKAFI